MLLKRHPDFVVSSLLFFCSVTILGQPKPEQAQKSELVANQSDDRKQKSTPGGVQILSDTQGVDFKPFLQEWHRVTQTSWDKLIPQEVNAPTLRKGAVVIRFKILPDGKLKDHSMILEGRSGDTALDRAAWGAVTDSHYPVLPSEFHGPYVELRAIFLYNMKRTDTD